MRKNLGLTKRFLSSNILTRDPFCAFFLSKVIEKTKVIDVKHPNRLPVEEIPLEDFLQDHVTIFHILGAVLKLKERGLVSVSERDGQVYVKLLLLNFPVVKVVDVEKQD